MMINQNFGLFIQSIQLGTIGLKHKKEELITSTLSIIHILLHNGEALNEVNLGSI
jgi:hypothetical protein